jgi:hypothetical protein
MTLLATPSAAASTATGGPPHPSPNTMMFGSRTTGHDTLRTASIASSTVAGSRPASATRSRTCARLRRSSSRASARTSCCSASHSSRFGKVECRHQTQKKWIAAKDPTTSITELQRLLGTFTERYNTARPPRPRPAHPRPGLHRPPKATPQRPRAAPLPDPPAPTPPDPKPRPPAPRYVHPTTGYATTSSTTAPSPCATTAASTTSASARPTPACVVSRHS